MFQTCFIQNLFYLRAEISPLRKRALLTKTYFVTNCNYKVISYWLWIWIDYLTLYNLNLQRSFHRGYRLWMSILNSWCRCQKSLMSWLLYILHSEIGQWKIGKTVLNIFSFISSYELEVSFWVNEMNLLDLIFPWNPTKGWDPKFLFFSAKLFNIKCPQVHSPKCWNFAA